MVLAEPRLRDAQRARARARVGAWVADAAALVALVLLAVALNWPALHSRDGLPASGEGSDLWTTHWGNAAFLKQAVAATGRIPLWNPHTMSGRPFAGDPLAAIFYPPMETVHLFSLRAFFLLLLVGHLALAGVGAYALARRGLGLSAGAALIAGTGFMLSPRLVGHYGAGHLTMVMAAAWLPWIALGLVLAIRDHPVWAAPTGLALGLAILAGHPQLAFYALLMMAAIAAGGTIWAGRRAWPWGRRAALRAGLRVAGSATAAVAIGGLVGAALALPALEFTAVSLRQHGLAVQDSIGILRFLRDLVRVPFDQPKPQENTFMPGLAVLALAPLALLRRRPLALALWGAVLAAAVLAIGARTPVMPLLAAHVPGFGYFRAPGRIWFLGALALPLLAGLGADALPGPRPLTRALHVLLVALVVAGVWHTDRALLNVKPAGPGHTAMHLEEKAAQLAGDSRIYGVQRNFRQSMVTALGAELADGQDPLQIAAYARFMQYAGGYRYDDYAIAIPPFEVYDRDWPTHQDAQPSARVLGLLNVGVVLSRHQLYDTALVEVGKEDDTYIYRNDAVLPRAFLVSADLGRDLERMDAAELARRTIIGDVAPDARAGRAAVTVVGLDGLVVRVDAPAAAYLVVGDPWYPGWRASIDGRPAPIGKVGGVLQGVAIPAGTHEVRIEYRPASVQRGLLLSLAGLIAAALWTVWYARPWPALRRSGGGHPSGRVA